MWTGTTTRGKVVYVQRAELEKAHSQLIEQNKQLLTKIESMTKLVEQMLSILLSYNPKLAEQTKEELEKINEQTDDTKDKSTGDIPG
tara:strand:- start:3082 stop:3342 length:261 start_codon:yes stop_codon:yes gene_type:complete